MASENKNFMIMILRPTVEVPWVEEAQRLE